MIVERIRITKSSKSFISLQACEFTTILVSVVRAPVGRYTVIINGAVINESDLQRKYHSLTWLSVFCILYAAQ